MSAAGELSAGWVAALSEAWNAYLHGSYAIGAVVVDEVGASSPVGATGWAIRVGRRAA